MSRLHRAHLGKLLRISSEDKSPGQTNANFTVTLNNSPFVQKVKATILKSVSFKNVFPNVYLANSKFSFEYGGTPSSITVPIGWYNLTDFIASVNALLVANPVITGSVVLSAVVDPLGATSAQNTKIRFVSDLPLTLYGKDLGNASGDLMGIPQSSSTTALDITAEYLPDLGGISVVYLCSNAIASANASASSDGGESLGIITEIPVNVPFGAQVYYLANDSTLESISYQNSRQLTNVDLQLCTRAGRILDLQQNALTALFRMVPEGTHSVG